MSAASWGELDRIFAEARELPVDERAKFIARACGEDVALRTEALSLLEADAASEAFMERPALDQLADAIAAEGWSLRPGEQIGPYRILQLLGSGGAGEVWRARDERLARDVAIKVLLPHFTGDADRLRRFADEARTAGALNHSNIVTVYDVGEHHGVPYLVAECLEGQSLRHRLEAGAVSARDALTIALGIARGLAAAHARSIVHRDLKPENTFLRSDGGVKILDFGLAKLQLSLQGVPPGTMRTMTGVIVGTAGYMAPEQIRSEAVDARADLFALGVMLYEMLAGKHPFRGGSTFDTLHAVLTVDPPDVTSMNAGVPTPLGRIVMRLLEKAPEARFQSALDVVWALEQVKPADANVAASTPPAGKTVVRWWNRPQVAWVAAAAVTALALLAVWARSSGTAPEAGAVSLTRFTWDLPAGLSLGSAPMVSPDGRRIAFAATVGSDNATSGLYVRERGSTDAVLIPGTERATQPFWSPDSMWLGFFARFQLMKIALQGGAPLPLADVFFGFGGAWNGTGTIVFGQDLINAGLQRVAADGGTTERATLLDASRGETAHCCPVYLPDGIHFLYFVRSADDARRGIYFGGGGTPSAAGTLLLRSDSEAIYVPLPEAGDGVLLYVVGGRVEARRFDPARRRLAADARTIGDVSTTPTTLRERAMLSASPDVLAFATTAVPDGNRIEAVDRSGRRLRLWDAPEAQNWPRLSPDGRYLARQRVDPLRNTPDIWVEDLERGTTLRVTTAIEPDIRPVWSPDGRHLAYVSGNLPGRPGKRVLTIAAADGTGIVRTLPCPREYCEPTDWTVRGLLVNVREGAGADVWVVPTEDGAAAQPLLAEPFVERDARMSPAGRWVAYVSNESGRPEVSVRRVSGPAKRLIISGDGGDQPLWRRDGRELFFVDPLGQLRAVPVTWDGDGLPQLGPTAKLDIPPIGRGHWGTPYDVSADGSRIYFLRRNDDPPPREIHVIIGWRTLLN
jgi:Tol biopolymer transport system component